MTRTAYLAQTTVDIGEKFFVRGTTGIGSVPEYQSLGGFISAILPNIFVISGIIMFAIVVFGGFMMITSSGDAKKSEAGKGALTAAVTGFVVIFVAYWLIRIVEYLTGIAIF